MEIIANGPHDDLPRVEANPDLHLDAMRAADLFTIVTDRLLHGQRRIAGAHGMIFMGEWRPKQGHDAIPHDLVHRPLIAVHRGHHALQHRIEELARLFRIAVRQQFHRALEVGKQHGDLLAFTFQRAAGGQDLLGEVWWRVGQRRAFLVWRGRGDGNRGRGEVAGPHQPPARFIGDLLMSKEERVFQVFQRRLIELELPLERAIGHAAPLA